jgi:excinuclease ABC subunit C
VSREAYKERLDKAMAFLGGDYAPVIKELKMRMQEASEKLEFEEAARYRDLLEHVQSIAQKQKIEDMNQEDKDIVALARDEEDAVVQVFFVRAGRMVGREHFYMKHSESESSESILTSFVKQFYAGTPFIPRQIMMQEESSEKELIEQWLSAKRGSRVYLLAPQKGQKEKLVELANTNAGLILDKDRERLKREEGRTIGAVKEIAELLGLARADRMEAYDISNISGFANVGSMVVYEKGKPKRSDYRKFRIKSVAGPNDYACMKEVLTRRFRHGMEEQKELDRKRIDKEFGSFTKFPDVLMMDGGRGQVNIALQVLDELGLSIPVCGMVKDDHHRTRGLYYNNIEIPIDRSGEAFKLITRIQDEAHRFAIEYHRLLRSKGQVHSVLEDIEGIGAARRKALMRTFKTVEAIRDADIEELTHAPSMNRQAALSVYRFFHEEKGEGTDTEPATD